MHLPPLPPSTPKDLRKFGLQIGGVFLLFTAFLVWRNHPILYTIAGLLSVYLMGFGLIKPEFLEGFHRGWWTVTFVIGHYMGFVIFSILYLVIFTPVSLIARVVGFDPLGLRKFRKVESYWHDRGGALATDHYEKQFAKNKEKGDVS